MPDEKLRGCSSAGKPLVEDGLPVDFPIATGKEARISRLVSAMMIGQALVTAVVVVGSSVCVWLFVTAHASKAASLHPVYINLVMDINSVPSCAIPLTHLSSPLPCLKNRKLMTGSKEEGAGRKAFPIGPMKCRDDAHAESMLGPNNCDGNPFILAENGTDVIIPEAGVYSVHSTVTFDDAIDFYLSSIIRITPARCVADPTCASSVELRDSVSHTWLSCFSHNGPTASPSSPRRVTGMFTACSIDGLRRFDKGDAVSLQVTQAFRVINPFHKLTRMSIHRL